jgi:hypothetical protein
MRRRTGIIAVGHDVYGTLASGGSAAKQFRRRAAIGEVVLYEMAVRDTAMTRQCRSTVMRWVYDLLQVVKRAPW